MLARCVRRRVRRIYFIKKSILVTVAILSICIMIWKCSNQSEEVVPVTTSAGMQQYQMLHLPKWRDLLFSGVPRLGSATEPKVVIKDKNESSTRQIVRETILFFTNIDVKDMRSFLQAEIPILAATQSKTQVVSAMNLPDFPQFDSTVNLSSSKPLVGIYHTHTAESFIPSSGRSHCPGGQRGDIVQVGEALSKRLNTYGILAVQSTTIHDYPSFMKAYGASETTVKNMLSENPSLQMIFDIHRDAEKRENYIATVNGVQVARMMIIVTTGQPGLVQPHWQSNHAFAKLIDAKMNQKYPGVSRGIRLVDWRYNQHLHPRALLIEVGCQENTKEEAERGIELLGDIVAEIIAENK